MKQPLTMIGYRLSYAQHRVERAFIEVLRKYCIEHGKTYVVTPQQWGVMAVLYESGEQTIGTVAQKLGIDAAGLTGLFKRLEQSGLVERVHDRDDRRTVNVSLTTEGQDIIHLLEPIVAMFDAQLMPDDQRQAFLHYLEDLITRVSLERPSSEKTVDLP